MHDPYTQIKSFKYFTLWHKDPEHRGNDDSCGWFLRSYHGDKEVLKKIRSAIEFEFDRTYKSETGTVYYVGYFSPTTGMPNYSTMGITLDMFSKAAWAFYYPNWSAYKNFMRTELFDILHFAENNTDSLKDEITGTFRIGTGTEWNEKKREEAIDHYASVIYGWILRKSRPWYRHPRWHVSHWRISLNYYAIPFVRDYMRKKHLSNQAVDQVLRDTV